MNPMHSPDRSRIDAELTRRALFGRGAAGLGIAALSGLLAGDSTSPNRALADGLPEPTRPGQPLPGLPHSPPRAKRVVYLFQNGAPTHVDLFDYKPKLREWQGKQLPAELLGDKRFSTMTGGQQDKPALGEVTEFKQHGDSGAWVSSFLPRIAEIADELCFVKSMYTEAVNHAPAITFFLTGSEMPGRPSMGSWLTYGLGNLAKDLPEFVVMTSRDQEASCGQIFYDFYWGSGFLPTRYQGVQFRGIGDPVLYIANPDGISRAMRRGILDDLAKLNSMRLDLLGDPEIATRISQYEMAYQMQASVPELIDLSDEPQHILDRYGPDVKRQGSFAYNCLIARRLIERDVRFVQLMHAGWDQHRNLNTQLQIQCRDTDAPSAALVQDLKERGLLDDTLVIWGGEFGRTPFLQGKMEETETWGRDHHPYGFTIWMAGGGIRPGISYGATDEFGFNAIENRVHVHDFQATVLHLLGIDHERLTHRFQGRQFRLTDVHGQVVQDILA